MMFLRNRSPTPAIAISVEKAYYQYKKFYPITGERRIVGRIFMPLWLLVSKTRLTILRQK